MSQTEVAKHYLESGCGGLRPTLGPALSGCGGLRPTLGPAAGGGGSQSRRPAGGPPGSGRGAGPGGTGSHCLQVD